MPGPLSTNRKIRAAAPSSPPRKIAKRLAGRVAATPSNGNGYTFHKPGSQNRKK